MHPPPQKGLRYKGRVIPFDLNRFDANGSRKDRISPRTLLTDGIHAGLKHVVFDDDSLAVDG